MCWRLSFYFLIQIYNNFFKYTNKFYYLYLLKIREMLVIYLFILNINLIFAMLKLVSMQVFEIELKNENGYLNVYLQKSDKGVYNSTVVIGNKGVNKMGNSDTSLDGIINSIFLNIGKEKNTIVNLVNLTDLLRKVFIPLIEKTNYFNYKSSIDIDTSTLLDGINKVALNKFVYLEAEDFKKVLNTYEKALCKSINSNGYVSLIISYVKIYVIHLIKMNNESLREISNKVAKII